MGSSCSTPRRCASARLSTKRNRAATGLCRDGPALPDKPATNAPLCTALGSRSDSTGRPPPWHPCSLPQTAWRGAFDKLSCGLGEDAVVDSNEDLEHAALL